MTEQGDGDIMPAAEGVVVRQLLWLGQLFLVHGGAAFPTQGTPLGLLPTVWESRAVVRV
jgi:hypothetical protein